MSTIGAAFKLDKAPNSLSSPAIEKSTKSSGFSELYEQVLAFEKRVVGGEQLLPKDLILYQIKASRLGLGVELVSKVAEALSATIRKLQSNQ